MAKTSKGLVFALIVIVGLAFLVFALVEQTTAQIQSSNVTPFCYGTYLIANDSSTNNLVTARNCKTGVIDFGGLNSAGGISGKNSANAVIQQALNVTYSIYGGGTLFLQNGKYNLTKPLNVWEGDSLIGESQGWTTTQNGANIIAKGNFSAIQIRSFTGTIVHGFFTTLSYLLLQGAANAADTINFGVNSSDPNTFDLFINRIEATNFYNAVYNQAGAKMRIIDSTLEGNKHDGIRIPNNNYLLNVIDTYIRNNGDLGVFINSVPFAQFTNDQFILNTNGGLTVQRFGSGYLDTITGNIFDSNGGTSNLIVSGSGANSTVTGNTFWNETNTVPQYDIFVAGDATVTGNIFKVHSSSIKPILVQTNNSIIAGNSGYNALGVVTNFIFSGGTGVRDGTFISPIGTTSTLTASTAYTISDIPVLILIQVVGLSTISINGGVAITPTIGESFYLYPKQTINFGAFGGSPPTLQVVFS